MPNAISNDLKEQIMARVREGKITVVKIAHQHGVKVNAVYNRVSKSMHEFGGRWLVVSRLKRENAFLKQLLGQLVLDVEGGKNHHSWERYWMPWSISHRRKLSIPKGSEYDSRDFTNLIESLEIKISMSARAAPGRIATRKVFQTSQRRKWRPIPF